MRIHVLKTWPEYFERVVEGSKTFEIRKNDRGFVVGDLLRLIWWNPETNSGGDMMCDRVVTYITDFEQKPGYVVMGMKAPNPESAEEKL